MSVYELLGFLALIAVQIFVFFGPQDGRNHRCRRVVIRKGRYLENVHERAIDPMLQQPEHIRPQDLPDEAIDRIWKALRDTPNN